MFTIEDKPSIEHGIWKRLSKEPGVSMLGVRVKDLKKCIRVEVMYAVENWLSPDSPVICKSVFELKPEFYLRDVHNEIDEIAEHAKEARRKVGVCTALITAPQFIKGSGLRGRWNEKTE